MNGKGSKPRPFSIDIIEFTQKFDNSIKNPKDLYRNAIMDPHFSEKYPNLTGNWGEDRELWMQLLTFDGC